MKKLIRFPKVISYTKSHGSHPIFKQNCKENGCGENSCRCFYYLIENENGRKEYITENEYLRLVAEKLIK